MKKLIVFILLAIPVILSAQERILINRVDEQTGMRIVHQINTVPSDRYPLLIQSSQSNGKSFSLFLHDSSGTTSANVESIISGDLTNTSKFPINIVFERAHLKIDSEVSSSICLDICYADFVDTIDASNAFKLMPGTVNSGFTFHIYSHKDLSYVDTLIDYVKLTALTGDPNDTISFILSGIITPASGVKNSLVKGTNPKITSVYPSPLVQGNSIKVKVSSPKESSLSYSIYDAVGRVIAMGVTRQHIIIGDNTIGINALEGLVNGSYLLKMTFADGSSDTHFFQVLR